MRPKTIPYEKIKADLLADPETKQHYDAVEPAYQIARMQIERGITRGEGYPIPADNAGAK